MHPEAHRAPGGSEAVWHIGTTRTRAVLYSRRRMKVWVWVAVAVAARVLVWLAARDAGVFADMSQYHERALALLSTGAMPDALRGPGYPVALAVAYTTSLPHFDAARLMHALLGGALTWTTARVAQQAGAGPRQVWAAAAVAVGAVPAGNAVDAAIGECHQDPSFLIHGRANSGWLWRWLGTGERPPERETQGERAPEN